MRKILIPERPAEIEVVYNNPVPVKNRLMIANSEMAVKVFRSVWPDYEHREHCLMLLLNRCSNVLGYYKLSTGGIDQTIIDPRIVFQVALKANASAIYVAHNHPSGYLYPSTQDVELTFEMRNVARLMHIQLRDHIILTRDDYTSLKERGYL